MSTVSRKRLTEFQAKIDRAALDNSDLPRAFITESLKSLAAQRQYSTPFVPRSRTNIPIGA